MISIRNVKKSFGTSVALENINLEIEKGETIAIIGSSGSGKSTLLRCINRLVEPDCGEILINGQNILDSKADVDAIRRRMGMVYQDVNLFSHLNVLENIILAPMKVLGMEKESAIKEAEALLEQVGMLKHKYKMPQSLSGGQKQRAAIARALAMHPDVMLFDEPTSYLDPTMVDEVETVIHSLADSGMTCVIVTHEMRFAKSIASRVVFLAEKGIYEVGTPKEIFDNPRRKLTRQFLYHSRMLECSFTQADFEPYELRREMTDLISRYDHTAKQLEALSVLVDEVIYPLLQLEANEGKTVSVRLMCSETSTNHIIMLNVEGMKEDMLSGSAADAVSMKLIETAFRSVMCTVGENGAEYVFQM